MRSPARRLPLRTRVALAAGATLVIAVAVLGAITFALVARQLHRSLDRGLHDRAVEVAQLAATTPQLITAPGVLEGRVGTSAAFVQVLDRRGRIVARSAALGGRVLPASPALERALRARRAGYGTVDLGGERLRLYAAPLPAIGGGPAAGGAVAVAGETSGVAGTLQPLRKLFVVVALATALVAAALATLLTRRALRPLTRLTAGAEAIARTGDPGRRLPAGGAQDEVGRLAATLNAMLAALERARERERRFVGDASHELRTPLTALRGNAAYVARHGSDPAVLADIESDAERLSALLDDLLALAREDAAAPPADAETVDLAALAREVAAAHPAASVRAPDGPVLVRGDRAALERALRNLVENAERHGPPGGAITVDATLADGRARLAVSDEGAGLTDEQAEHAFARFWRGPDAPPGGTGLGLAIVQATAVRHGGRASAHGATFALELPPAPLSHRSQGRGVEPRP